MFVPLERQVPVHHTLEQHQRLAIPPTLGWQTQRHSPWTHIEPREELGDISITGLPRQSSSSYNTATVNLGQIFGKIFQHFSWVVGLQFTMLWWKTPKAISANPCTSYFTADIPNKPHLTIVDDDTCWLRVLISCSRLVMIVSGWWNLFPWLNNFWITLAMLFTVFSVTS